MASPRRSPRFIEPSPKPELPKKPRRPERVQDPAADSVRQANYKVDLAAWEAAKEEHEKLIQKRQAKQKAAWKEARKKRRPAPGRAPSCSRPAPPQLTALGVAAFATAPHSA